MIDQNIINNLEQEQKEILYTLNNWSDLKVSIDLIKSLFWGYLSISYNAIVLLWLCFVTIILLIIDEWFIRKDHSSWAEALVILLIIVFMVWFAVWGVYLHIRWRKIDANYNTLISRLTDFHRIKMEIKNNYSILIWRILSDIKSSGINTQETETIKNTLEKLAENYSQFTDINSLLNPEIYLISFKKNKQSFIDLMRKIRSQEREYLNSLKTKVTEKVEIWTLHHQSELQELEKSISNQANQTENADWKFALESQKMRLQSYIESINNLVK
jgi:uncharacterized membrane protein YjjP (DUF1212 family)